MADGKLFVTTPFARVVALDSESGTELWSFDPQIDRTKTYNLFINRGVAYWEDGRDKRVLFGTLEGNLFCLEARTGEKCADFGVDGIVNLKKGFTERFPRATYGVTSAPAVYKDKLIVSVLVEAKAGPNPAIRAFDVRTGRQVWQFDTIPEPGQVGHETWEGDSWVDRSGANAWITASIDVERRMVFAATGQAAYDFYGGDRKGQNLFGDSVIAINGDTGEYIWHFQTVHHDLWDYDLPAQPVLVTVNRDGKKIDAVVHGEVEKRDVLFKEKDISMAGCVGCHVVESVPTDCGVCHTLPV